MWYLIWYDLWDKDGEGRCLKKTGWLHHLLHKAALPAQAVDACEVEQKYDTLVAMAILELLATRCS